MSTYRIADHQWQKLYAFLQGHPRAYAGQEEKCRRFVEAVYWILRTGAQWRELPADLGKWNSVFKRYARWEENGVWADMFKHRARPGHGSGHARQYSCTRPYVRRGRLQKRGHQREQCLGRSRGGFSSKIHLLVDALGFPLQFILTGGERHDLSQAESLLAPFHLTLSLPIRAMILTRCENCSQPNRSRWSSLLAAIASHRGTMTDSATKSATSSNAHQPNQVVSTHFHPL